MQEILGESAPVAEKNIERKPLSETLKTKVTKPVKKSKPKKEEPPPVAGLDSFF